MRRLALVCASLVFSLACVELGARAIFALRTDRSVFFYGTRLYRPTEAARTAINDNDGRRRWDQIVNTEDIGIKRFVDGPVGRYSFYVPRTRQTMSLANGESYEVVHNNFGFRGADFLKPKSQGVVRVITLGASSTFGYLDRDDETYPYYLEGILNARLVERGCDDVQHFEVLNFGIPHLNSDNIRALFLAEALTFNPDVVTFYEGANDTRRIQRPWRQRALLSLSPYSLSLFFLSHVLETQLETFSAEDLAAYLDGKPANFVANIAEIAHVCAKRRIRFVVSTQELRSFIVRDDRIDQVGYEQEVELVRARLAAGMRLNLAHLQLLMHAEIMAALRAWATTHRNVRFVDYIQTLERAGKRSTVRDWVHLSPEGNRVLATRLADEVYPPVCRSTLTKNKVTPE